MWVLVGILLTVEGVHAKPFSLHATMEQCFEAREAQLLALPKPKINYEIVCIRTDLFNGV